MTITLYRRIGGVSRQVTVRTRSGMPIEFRGGGTLPDVLPVRVPDATYLGGSGRGQYLWYPAEHPNPVPPTLGGAVTDTYLRMLWREVEATPMVYNWAGVDAALAAAAARGGRLGIRFMPFHAGVANCLPDDLAAAASTRTITLDGVASRLPDWNSATYLARWAELMAAVAARYDNDARLYSIDVGGYGNWGEGHNFPYEGQYPGPGGQTEGTTASLQAIIRAATSNFSNTWIYFNPFMLRTGGALDVAGSGALLNYALAQSPRVGLRTDALGGGTIQGATLDIVAAAESAATGPTNDRPLGRWRTAPATSEWPGGTTTWGIRPGGTDGGFAAGARQVRDWHISLVSNGNFHDDDNGYVAYSPAERAAFDDACRSAGYRYAVTGLRAGLSGGTTAVLPSTWVNTGSAPTYDEWAVAVRLVAGDGQTATGTAALDLRTVLPGSPVTDVVTVSGVTAGRWSVQVRATNMTCPYASPLQFASGYRDGQGWHTLGDVDLA